MATYSRSQTTTQTAQSTAAMPSMDISSLLVKTMENAMNDKEGGEKGFEESVTNGINNSDLLKDKTKKDTDKELADLLKDKKNTDKELSNLLKDTNKNAKESKKEGSGKLVTGAIGATIGALFKSKSLGQATGAIVGGAGKAAGGLVSGVGNVGGSLIAGVGKLFGPIGGIIGKAVGAAVAVPFKAVGGLITGAIGGLAKLLSSPLKEIVTKGALIVGVLSQLFVFLEGLLAKFIAKKDIKWIDFMSKLKSSVSMIPDRIKIALEAVLSKVRIMGKPIIGGELTPEQEDQWVNLWNEKKQIEKETKGFSSQQTKVQEIGRKILTDEEMSQYNLASEEGREGLKQAILEKANSMDPEMLYNIGYRTDEIEDAFKKLDKRAKNISPEKMARLAEVNSQIKELDDILEGRFDYDKARKNLDDEQAKKQEEYFTQGLYDLSKKKVKDEKGNLVERGLTAYEQDYADKLHAGSVAKVEGMYAANNEVLTTKDATGAERFLSNQYKAWTDSWAKTFKDLKQDIGIDIKQKVDRPNPNISR